MSTATGSHRAFVKSGIDDSQRQAVAEWDAVSRRPRHAGALRIVVGSAGCAVLVLEVDEAIGLPPSPAATERHRER